MPEMGYSSAGSSLVRHGRRRVVVTGMGLVTCLGVGVPHVWRQLLAGCCGLTALTAPEYSGIPCRVAGVVPRGSEPGQLDLDAVVPRADQKTLSLASAYALVAAQEAMKQSKWVPLSREEQCRTGVAVGMGMVGLDEIVSTGNILINQGYRKVSPYFVPRILTNMAAGQISIRYRLKGPNHSVSTACTTGLHAIGDASRFIAHGDADVMLAGGTEACVTPLALAGFSRARALASRFNDRPAQASRPFDRDRDGFVMSEGAGVLVLEELEHALRRGATVLGEILGYGLAGDAEHITAPSEDGDGAYRCMQSALRDARLDATSVGHVNAHATSTQAGDIAEALAIQRLFNSCSANQVPSSILTGQSQAASCSAASGSTNQEPSYETIKQVDAVHCSNYSTMVVDSGEDRNIQSEQSCSNLSSESSFSSSKQNINKRNSSTAGQPDDKRNKNEKSTNVENVLVTSTKGAVGHLLGAAGAVEAIFTLMACQSGIVPPTLNCDSPSVEEVGFTIVRNSELRWPIGRQRIALTNSFGFGGTNASLCVSAFKS